MPSTPTAAITPTPSTTTPSTTTPSTTTPTTGHDPTSHDPASHDPASHDPTSHDPTSHDPTSVPDLDQLGPVDAAVWRGREPSWLELVELARQLGPDPTFADVDDGQLTHRIQVQAAQLAALTCEWLTAVAELVVRGVWADQGARSPAQWLAHLVGLAPSTAREQVRVALRLRELPLVRARFAAGRVSYSKVRAITRITVPELQELLLRWCDHATAAQIERVVRGFTSSRRATADDPGTREDHHGMTVTYEDEDTMLVCLRVPVPEGQGLVDDAERLLELERRAAASSFTSETDAILPDGPLDAAETPGDRRSRASALADVVLQAVRAAVLAGPVDTTGDDRTTLVLHVPVTSTGDGEHPAGDRPDPERRDACTPAGNDASDRSGRTVVHDRRGTPRAMSPRALRRLACDAFVVVVREDRRGQPLDVGRRQRTLTTALRRAVLSRDRGCRFPGCDATRHLHAHHVHEWIRGGPTDLDNLVVVCGFHHRLIHAAAWEVSPHGQGRFTFAPSDGSPVPDAPRPPVPWPPELRLRPVPSDGRELAARSSGDGLDLAMAVDVITQELARAVTPTAA